MSTASASASPIAAAHEVFRALLLALAHPGRPFASGARSVEEALGAVYELDTPVWRSPGWEGGFGVPVAAAEARLLLVAGDSSAGALASADRGSEGRPERAATVIYAVSPGSASTPTRLSGPGIDGALEVELRLARRELADRADACATLPLGVDVLTFDADGVVTGLPRTTRVEVRG